MFLTKNRQDLCIEQNGLLSDNIFMHNYLRQLLYYVLKTQFNARFLLQSSVVLCQCCCCCWTCKPTLIRSAASGGCSSNTTLSGGDINSFKKSLKCSFYKICDTTIVANSFQWWQIQMQYQYNTATSVCFNLQENMIVSI